MMTDDLTSIEVFDEAVDSLSHHGILGQKWGKQNGPPYPLDAEDHSASEKKAGWRKSLDSVASKFKRKKEVKAPEAEVKKKEPEREETPEERKLREAEEKKRIIGSGDAELVRANADKLSYQELNEAVNRVNLMQRLDQMTPKEDTTNKIDKAIQVIDENATRVRKGIDTYNKVADIYNRFSDPPLPLINESLSDRRKKEAEKEEKDRRQKALDALKKDPSKWVKNLDDLTDEEVQQLANRAGNMNRLKTQLGLFNKVDQSNQQNKNQNQNQNSNQDQTSKQNNGGNTKGTSEQTEGKNKEKQNSSNSESKNESSSEATTNNDSYKSNLHAWADSIRDHEDAKNSYDDYVEQTRINNYKNTLSNMAKEEALKSYETTYKQVLNKSINDRTEQSRLSEYSNNLSRKKDSARSLDEIEKYGFSHSEEESDLPSFEYYAERLLEAIRA